MGNGCGLAASVPPRGWYGAVALAALALGVVALLVAGFGPDGLVHGIFHGWGHHALRDAGLQLLRPAWRCAYALAACHVLAWCEAGDPAAASAMFVRATGACGTRDHCGLMPDDWITLLQRAVSSAMKVANSSGVFQARS
jgi:hypothetical protein